MKVSWCFKGVLLAMGLFVAASTGSTHDTPQYRRPGRTVLNISGVLTEAVFGACRELGIDSCAPLDVSVTDLGADLAHYEIAIKVGSHPYDRIVLHRVVAEHWNGLPREGSHATMLLPSHVFPFESFYLPPTCPGDEGENICAAAMLGSTGYRRLGYGFQDGVRARRNRELRFHGGLGPPGDGGRHAVGDAGGDPRALCYGPAPSNRSAPARFRPERVAGLRRRRLRDAAPHPPHDRSAGLSRSIRLFTTVPTASRHGWPTVRN